MQREQSKQRLEVLKLRLTEPWRTFGGDRHHVAMTGAAEGKRDVIDDPVGGEFAEDRELRGGAGRPWIAADDLAVLAHAVQRVAQEALRKSGSLGDLHFVDELVVALPVPGKANQLRMQCPHVQREAIEWNSGDHQTPDERLDEQ